MKKIVFGLVCFISVFFTGFLNAQRCASMEHLKDQLQNDPAFAARYQQVEDHTNQFVANPVNQSSRAIITIPVVVHVVYNTAAQNISDAQIQSQIDRLNLDYHKLNTDWTNTPAVWQSLVADYEVQFCLASRDPNGNATTGIIRKSTSTTSFSTNDNVKRTANGGDDAWPAASYLNLWVCNLSGGVLGYAQFPGGAAATDGVVITYTGFGTGGTAQAPYNLGRTATHEVGHWLNLYHIWGDDGSGCSGSDQVGDTPNQGPENYGCPTYPHTDACATASPGVMFMNYMDYTDDACMYMFTNGQKTRSLALFASGGSRVSLLSSLGCQSISSPPVANFSADVTSSCTGLIRFTDLSTNAATSWSWNFGDGQTSTTQNPTHLFTTNGTFTVTLTATNTFGSNTKTLTSYITVNKPSAPAASDVSRCGAGTFTLTTSSTNPVAWFDSLGNKVSASATFITPVLSQSASYYVQDTVGGVQYHVGPANNSGSGSYFTNTANNWATVFNVNTACVLQSVYVYAGAGGNRTIELRNSGGTLLQTITTNIPAGASRVTLNFNLPVGTGYRLATAAGTTINLYRNNAGATYPYSDAGGYVNITGNTANNATAYYYFFYDWIIQGAGCVSERRQVNAIVSSGLTASTTVTNAACGSSNGSASVIISGGVPAYTYAWSNGGLTSSISNVPAATYTVTVTDVNACSGTASATVASAANLTSAKTYTNVTCYGGNNGSASVTVSNGTPAYTYVWSNAVTTNSNSGLIAGDYVVTITDGSNCVHVDSFTITQPVAIAATVTANSAHCNGEATGLASVVASGGNGGFNFAWSTNQSGNSIANLPAGNYQVTATDALNCSASAGFVIDEPAAITTNTTTTAVNCFGGTNGTANVIPAGGTGNFTYEWCNEVTTHNTSGLSAGNCTVTVTDDNGCSSSAVVAVQQPLQMVISTTTANATAAVDTVYGGVGPYTYLWSNGGTTPALTGLNPGNYIVTITDNNGCTSSAGVTVLQTNTEITAANAIAFNVYPNPSVGELILTLDKWTDKTTLTITDILGQALLNKNLLTQQSRLDLSGLANGVYLLELKQDDKKAVRQFVISR
jgi:PKD repeat protein